MDEKKTNRKRKETIQHHTHDVIELSCTVRPGMNKGSIHFELDLIESD